MFGLLAISLITLFQSQAKEMCVSSYTVRFGPDALVTRGVNVQDFSLIFYENRTRSQPVLSGRRQSVLLLY
jgi:hypothetical protein